jgi:hypothetical protein
MQTAAANFVHTPTDGKMEPKSNSAIVCFINSEANQFTFVFITLCYSVQQCPCAIGDVLENCTTNDSIGVLVS